MSQDRQGQIDVPRYWSIAGRARYVQVLAGVGRRPVDKKIRLLIRQLGTRRQLYCKQCIGPSCEILDPLSPLDSIDQTKVPMEDAASLKANRRGTSF